MNEEIELDKCTSCGGDVSTDDTKICQICGNDNPNLQSPQQQKSAPTLETTQIVDNVNVASTNSVIYSKIGGNVSFVYTITSSGPLKYITFTYTQPGNQNQFAIAEIQFKDGKHEQIIESGSKYKDRVSVLYDNKSGTVTYNLKGLQKEDFKNLTFQCKAAMNIFTENIKDITLIEADIARKPTLTKEQYNGVRLQLVRKVMTDMLRKRFHGSFSEDTRFFDEHTLIILIIHLYKLPAPKSGWIREPHKIDKSESATLVRFRIGKTLTQHAPVSISDKRFQSIYNYLKQALIDYGCSEDDIDWIVTHFPHSSSPEYIEEQERKEQARKTEQSRRDHLLYCREYGVLYNVFPAVDTFIGRENDLKEIHNKMLNLDGDLGLLIFGLPGIGKSQLARKYCNEYVDAHDGNILWINAQNISSIENDILKIAESIQLTIKYNNGMYMGIQVILLKIYHFFDYRKLLVIFDNVNNVEDIKPYLYPAKKGLDISLLVTSLEDFTGNRLQPHQLNVFSRDVASTYLELNSNISTAEERNETVELLEFHPLALSHAVGYVTSNNITFKQFCELFRSQKNPVNSPIITTFNLALEKLMKADEDNEWTTKLLHYMAHIDGKDIRKGFLLDIMDSDDMFELNCTIPLLRRYNLINVATDNVLREFPKHSISIHSLVQQAAMQQQIESGIQETIFEELLENIFSQENVQDVTAIEIEDKYWVDHFIHIFNNTTLPSIMLDKIVQERTNNFLLKVLVNMNKFDELIHVYNEIIKREKRQGNKKSRVSAITTTNLALCMRKKGNVKEAMLLLETLLEIAPLSPDIQCSYISHYAGCLYDTGDLKQAIVLYKTLESIQAKTPQHHFNLLQIQNDLAICLRDAGELRQVIEICRKIESIKSKTLPPHHSDILIIQNNIATCLRDAGELKQAIEIHRKVESIQSKILPQHHPDLLTAQNNLASCLTEAGELKKAIEIHRKVEHIQSKTLPQHHPDLLGTQNNLAKCLRDAGEFKHAIEILRKVESIQSKILPRHHPNLLTKQNNLASCLKDAGELKQAIEIFRNVESIRSKSLPPHHSNLLTTQNNLALCLRDAGELKQAIEIFRNVESIRSKSLPPHHSNLLKTQNNLALCVRDAGELKEAIEIHRKVESIQSKTLPPHHSNLLTTQNNLALCLKDAGELKQAFEIFRNVEGIQSKSLPPHHFEVLRTENNLASCLRYAGKLKQAIEIHRKVEHIQSKTLPQHHPDLLTTQNNLAMCLIATGELKEAIEILSKVESIQSKTLPHHYPNLLKTQNNLAKCLRYAGEFKQAIEIHRKVESIQSETLPQHHPDLLGTQNNLAKCLRDAGELKHGIEILRKVKSNQSKSQPPHQKHSLITQYNRLLYLIDNKEGMEEVVKLLNILLS